MTAIPGKEIQVKPGASVWYKALFATATSAGLFCFNVSLTVLILSSTPYPVDHELNIPENGLISDLIVDCAFTPFLETLLMWPMLVFTQFITRKNWLTCVIVALIWGVLHGIRESLWAVTGFTGFLVFSYFFLSGQRSSTKEGFWLAFSIHALNNTYGTIIYHLIN